MFRKVLIAAAAATTVGVAALAPTAASAGWGHHGHFRGGPFIGIGFYGDGSYGYGGCFLQKRKVRTAHGWRWCWVRVCY